MFDAELLEHFLGDDLDEGGHLAEDQSAVRLADLVDDFVPIDHVSEANFACMGILCRRLCRLLVFALEDFTLLKNLDQAK